MNGKPPPKRACLRRNPAVAVGSAWMRLGSLLIAVALLFAPPAKADEDDAASADNPPDAIVAGAPATSLATFEERRQATLEAFASGGGNPFVKAECLFELGRADEGLAEVNKGLDALVPGNKINRWMHGGNTGFLAWPGIDCYIRYGRFLDDATKERYRAIYTGGAFYARLSTSNHKIMAAVTRYLATQIWGPDAFHADPFFLADPYIVAQTKDTAGPVWGTYFADDDRTGERYIRSVILSTVQGGPGEYASRPYGAQNILPLLTIAACAKDAALAERARIAYEACLAQLAPAWLRGHLATFAPRSYPDTETQRPWGIATIPWLYFGGVAPALAKAEGAAFAATHPYRPPAAIVAAGTDREATYFYRAFLNGWALNHYVNRTYALFSRSAKGGGKPFQGQSYPCGVMWEEPDTRKGSHLWITNPAADEPGKMKIHTHGVRPFEQEVLGRDSLLLLFSVADDNPFPYALGYIPGGHRAVIDEAAARGRIFLHYGTALIAVTASQPFGWNPSAGILAPASEPRDGDSEFRIRAPACAIAIETAPPGDFPAPTPLGQLEKFRQALANRGSLELAGGKTPKAVYRNRHGDALECVFGGDDRVNGKKLDYRSWPVLESPWTSQESPSGPLVLTDGAKSLTHSFAGWGARP